MMNVKCWRSGQEVGSESSLARSLVGDELAELGGVHRVHEHAVREIDGRGGVVEELGQPEATVTKKKTDAQRQKIKSISHSGGNKIVQKKASTETKIDPEIRKVFKGFEDSELE